MKLYYSPASCSLSPHITLCETGLDCELGVLVPNKRGLDRAKSVGAEKFNIFLSPSETFNQNNLGGGIVKKIMEDLY